MSSNNLETLLKIPFVIDNLFRELRIKEQFENEKQIPVPNLKEFFDMTQKKEEIYVPNLKQFFELHIIQLATTIKISKIKIITIKFIANQLYQILFIKMDTKLKILKKKLMTMEKKKLLKNV